MTSSLQPRPKLLLAVVAFFALICGMGGQPQATEVSAKPLGRLVSVGQHSLHLYCIGSGSPTVVLEAGLGGNHLDWIRTQPLIGKITQACSYDRAGYGWSEPGPKPRTAERIASEFGSLLRSAGINGPIVLVGHSFGGMLSLYYTGRHPSQVVGLILVDSMHPDQFERFAAEGIDISVDPTHGIIHSSRDVVTSGIPRNYKALAYYLARQESARTTLFNEMRNIHLSLAQTRKTPQTNVLRAEVMLHGKRDWDRIYRDGRMENLWIKLQAELAERIGAGRLVVAARSGHQIALETPELVTKVVAGVIRDIRKQPD